MCPYDSDDFIWGVKIMKRNLIILFILGISLISIGLTSHENNFSDELYRNRIVGSWAEIESVYTVSTFEIDGTYLCKMWKSPHKREIILTEEGKWWIEDGCLYNTIHKTEPPLIHMANKPIVDIIVSISDTKMTLIDEEGQQYEKSKVN